MSQLNSAAGVCLRSNEKSVLIPCFFSSPLAQVWWDVVVRECWILVGTLSEGIHSRFNANNISIRTKQIWILTNFNLCSVIFSDATNEWFIIFASSKVRSPSSAALVYWSRRVHVFARIKRFAIAPFVLCDRLFVCANRHVSEFTLNIPLWIVVISSKESIRVLKRHTSFRRVSNLPCGHEGSADNTGTDRWLSLTPFPIILSSSFLVWPSCSWNLICRVPSCCSNSPFCRISWIGLLPEEARKPATCVTPRRLDNLSFRDSFWNRSSIPRSRFSASSFWKQQESCYTVPKTRK